MRKPLQTCLIFLVLLMNGTLSYAKWPLENCADYVNLKLTFDRTYYLLQQTLATNFIDGKKKRVLILGSGSGNADTLFLRRGWDVTSVDICPQTGIILKERARNLPGKLEFQNTTFNQLKLKGTYDAVFSYFSLPFDEKDNLNSLLDHLDRATQKNSVLSVNFFGPKHTFVNSGAAYSVTSTEIIELLNKYHYSVNYQLQREYNKPDASGHSSHWDVIDIIALKNR